MNKFHPPCNVVIKVECGEQIIVHLLAFNMQGQQINKIDQYDRDKHIWA